MRDADVRLAMAASVARTMATRPHVLVPEVEIRWTVPARADALLVADRISGFEIKSDVDSLSRLPRQIEAYGHVVERAYLVVGERHREKATGMVPDWWHVWAASWKDGNPHVRQVRRGRLNPDVDPLAVTSFISRDHLVRVLTETGERRLSSLGVDDLRLMLAGRLGRHRTLQVAREHLLTRPDWRARALRLNGD